jgi:hypothetical protein
MKGTVALAAVVGLSLVSTTAAETGEAVAPDRPTAEQVLDAYVGATGGKEAYARIENRVTRGRMELVAQNIEMAVTIWAARPNKTYLSMTSDVTGPIESGTTGDLVWENSAMMGPQIKEGAEKAEKLREAIFDRWPAWREVYAKVEYAGVEEIEGRPAHKVVATPADAEPHTLYFDRQSKLLVRLDLTLVNAMGSFPARNWFSDYREVDGLLLPFTVTTELMGQRLALVGESVEHNVELPADRFDPPAAIREVLNGRPEPAAGGTAPDP